MVEVIKSGCFMSVQLEEVCVVSKPPLKINKDSEFRLHSTTEGAVIFMDGYEQHYVHGRFIESETFKLCDNLEAAGKRFFKETNEDIKAIICFIIRDRHGEAGLLKMLGAYLYKEEKVQHTNSYSEVLRLYRTKEKFNFLMDSNGVSNQPYCWLEYTCPSTGTIYLIDTFANFTTPLEAAKFHRPAPVPFELEYEWQYFAN
jgi:hypothetical protein